MSKEIVGDGIRLFAQQQSLRIAQPDELMFTASLPGEPNPVLFGIELFGLMVSITFICGALPNSAVAPALLRKNWGGVESTCFFFSVKVEQGEVWLNLETRQFVGPDPTPERVASLLATCWMFADQAKEALKT